MKLGKISRSVLFGTVIALSGCDKPSLEYRIVDARTSQSEETQPFGDVPEGYYFPMGDTDKTGLPDPTYGSVYPMGDDDRSTWDYMSKVYKKASFFKNR